MPLQNATLVGASEHDDRVRRSLADGAARALKLGAGRSVFLSDAASVVIKLRRVRLRDRVRGHLFAREARGYALLREAGVVTASFAVPFSARDAGGVRMQGLAVPAIEGRSLIDALSDGSMAPEHLRAVGASLARAALAIADAGLLHRDCKPSNVMLTTGEDGAPVPVLIDPDGVRARRGVETAGDAVARVAFSLVVEPHGLGIAVPRDAMRAFLNAAVGDGPGRSQRRRALLGAVVSMLRAHGDPRPTTDPRSNA